MDTPLVAFIDGDERVGASGASRGRVGEEGRRVRARTVGAGPRSFAGLRLIVRLGAVDRVAWAAAMGWGQTTGYSHATRLEKAGLAIRQRTQWGSGSLLVATAEGASAVGREDLGAGSAAGPSTWAHARAVSWVAAALEREGRRWISERELRLEGGFWRLTVTSKDAVGVARRHSHLPDLGVVSADRRAGAYEVELQSKRKARVRGILAAYKQRLETAADELETVVYVVDSPRVGKLVEATATEVGLGEGLAIRTLDELIAKAERNSSEKRYREKGG